MAERNTRIRASQIINILPSDIDATNSPVDNYVPTYDLATGKFTWSVQTGGVGSGNAFSTSFTNTDLSSAGILIVNHALGADYPIVEIYDNNENVIIPDEITYVDSDNINVDLSSFAPISGTWHIRCVIGGGGATELNDLNDVNFDSGTPADNYIMRYDSASGKWKAEALTVEADKIEEGDSLIEVVDLGTGYIKFQVDNVEQLRLIDGKFYPIADDDIIFGDASHRIKELHLMPSSLYLGATHVTEQAYNRNEINIMLNAFRIAINGSLTQFGMVDGIIDEFEDESGIDTGASTNEDYDSTNDLYKPSVVVGLELDYFEYATDGAAQTAYVTDGDFISNADIDDEDMADISDWTDSDSGTGVSSQVTFDSKSCMKLDTGASAGVASRQQDIGSFGNRTVFSFSLYHVDFATDPGDNFEFKAFNGTDMIDVMFRSSGLYIYSSGWNEVGTDLVIEDTWQEWTFDMDWVGLTVDVYLDKTLIAANVTCHQDSAVTEGTVIFNQGGASNNIVTYIDWFKAGSDGIFDLQCYSESSIKNQGSYSLKVVALQTHSLNDTLTRQSIISNGNIDDEDMADISDWTDLDGGTGVSSQVTFDSKSCMKLDTGATPGGYAQRQQDIGSFGTRTVFSFSVYCETIGIRSNIDFFQFYAGDGATRLDIEFASDGLFIFDGASYVEVGTNLVVQDTWQEWTFDIDWVAQTVDVYLDGVLKASDVDCSYDEALTDGQVNFRTYGNTTANQIAYVDWFKAGDASVGRIDLTDKDELKFDVYVSRIGTNIQLQIHDSGGTTSTKDIAIGSGEVDTWKTITWDISGISNANKDNIDSIIIKIINADETNTFYIDNFYVPGLTNNMTLIANTTVAEIEPDSARLVLFEEDVDSITLQTDLKAYVSRDGGSTWAQVTLSDEGDYETNKRILTGIVDLTQSGIGSGTNMEYKIESLNNKNLKLHGVGCLWD